MSLQSLSRLKPRSALSIPMPPSVSMSSPAVLAHAEPANAELVFEKENRDLNRYAYSCTAVRGRSDVDNTDAADARNQRLEPMHTNLLAITELPHPRSLKFPTPAAVS